MNDRSQMRFHDPNAPRFPANRPEREIRPRYRRDMFVQQQSMTLTVSYDVDFYPALIPQRGSGNFAKNQFQMDITTSTLFLKLVGRTKHLGDFVVYTAGNFRVTGEKPLNCRMLMRNSSVSRSDTATVRSWTSPALPPTIDFAGPNGSGLLPHYAIELYVR